MTLFALLLLAVAADDKAAPKPKFPLGKDTTVVTGPLDRDGFIDYEAALNDRLGKGITPEKNATVLIWQALGPRPEGGRGMPAEFFKRLGIKEPPAKGDYLLGMHTFLKEHLKLDPSDFQSFYDQQGNASRWPWTAKDYPQLAQWLQLNEKPLALFVEASKRPEYFSPLASHRSETKPGSDLLGVLLPGVQKCREAAAALSARALLRVGEGKFDEAWQDLLACHRLGRLMTRGATLIEALVGFALEHIACNATLAYIERANLTTRQIEERLKDLRALPPLAPIADKVALGERFMFLDCVKIVRHGGVGGLEALAGGGGAPRKLTPKMEAALSKIDWAPALRNGNRWFDRMSAAMRGKDRAARMKDLMKIEQDLRALKGKTTDPAELLELLARDEPGKVIGETIGNVLIALLMPAVQKVQTAQDRVEQINNNLRLAFALAAYRRDNDRYPAKLDDLAPKYLKEVPGDTFSGKALIYKPEAKGYLFYSVGMNGKDDGGQLITDEPPGDDLGVRMPLPALKTKK